MNYTQKDRLEEVVSYTGAQIGLLIVTIDGGNILSGENRIRMMNSLLNFCIDATNKYIAGQKEHGDHITDRDLDKEIRNEQIDSFWYSEAKQWKQQKK